LLINFLSPVNHVFLSALVVLDRMKEGQRVEDLSSEDSTIDIMSSGDEHIDITNDLDPPENSNQYITDVNSSISEIAQEYLLFNFLMSSGCIHSYLI